MVKVSTYLNFPRETEVAFNFYKSVFGGDFTGPVLRFGDIPQMEGTPPMAEDDKKLVMHIRYELPGGHALMGTDAPDTMGFSVYFGNNIYIQIETDSRDEADRIFNALSDGGKVETEMQDMFWGGYFGSFTDKFGVNWMIQHEKAQ